MHICNDVHARSSIAAAVLAPDEAPAPHDPVPRLLRAAGLAAALALAAGCTDDAGAGDAADDAADDAGDAARADVAEADAALASVNCAVFQVTGTPSAQRGATWVYRSTDSDGVYYDLSGILLAPAGAGPFPAIVVSHGYGGSATGYSGGLGATLRSWGLVVIATNYTHAAVPSGAPTGGNGASGANIARAWKARQLLSCVASVDTARVAAHGHSMGAFVTTGLLAAHPTGFLVASHTAGGVHDGAPSPQVASPHASVAEAIVTPYQLHHGDQDVVVRLQMDQRLDQVLTGNGVPHELRIYPGVDHANIARHATMLSRVRAWYTTHGLL